MSKNLKWAIGITICVILLGLGGLFLIKQHTKSFSPEDTVTYQRGNLQLEVYYNRPFKKGRRIFGGLVPYGKVWRTGANEPTTFKTKTAILVDGSPLQAGKYSLWTIPDKKSWKVIFNKKMYSWGVRRNSNKASRDPDYDVLVLEVPVVRNSKTIERFSIYFEQQNELTLFDLAWDRVLISIPIKAKS